MKKNGMNFETLSVTMNRTASKSILALSLVSILSTAVPSWAFARSGGSDGGGGGAILCKQDDGSYTARLVDLEESEFWDKQKPSKELEGLSWQKQFEIARDRLGFVDPDFHSELRAIGPESMSDYLKETQGTKKIFPAPQDLSTGRVPPMDAGCQLVGAAVYSDDGSDLRISHFIWKLLPDRDKAALLLHESAYRAHRQAYEKTGRTDRPNSSATRKLVGFAFSSEMDGRPEPREHIKRFKQPGNYDTYSIRWKHNDPMPDGPAKELRNKLYDLLYTFLPYTILETSRPVYLDKGACRNDAYEIEVVDDPIHEKSRRCEFRLQRLNVPLDAYGAKTPLKNAKVLRPYKVENKLIKKDWTKSDSKFFSDRTARTYRFKFNPESIYNGGDGEHGEGQISENIVVRCRSDKSDDEYTPPIKLLCGDKVVAETDHVLSRGDKSASSVMPIKYKPFYVDHPRDPGEQPGDAPMPAGSAR